MASETTLDNWKKKIMRKSEEKGPNFWGFQLPILRLTYLESSRNFWKFGINKKDGYFFLD